MDTTDGSNDVTVADVTDDTTTDSDHQSTDYNHPVKVRRMCRACNVVS